MSMPKFKLKRREVKAFLLLFPFVEVHVINTGHVYHVAVLLASVYVVYLIASKKLILRKKYIPLIAYTIWLMLSCYINNLSMIPGLYYGVKLFAFTQVVEYYIQKQEFVFFSVTQKYIAFCMVMTTVFQFLNQDLFGHIELSGNYNNFAFGDNMLGNYYIPFIAICIVMDRMRNREISLKTWIMIAIATISLLRAWSASSVVGIAIIIVYVLFVYGKKISKIFNPFFVVVTYVVAEVGLVVFNIQNRFSYLIETFLHKNVTLTGRIGIWYNAINNIYNSPVYGHGVTKGGNIKLSTTFVGTRTLGAHNIILEVLMQVGYVGLVLWLTFIFASIFLKKKEIKSDEDSYYMLLFFAYVVMIMQLALGNVYVVFCYFPIILCANVNHLFDKKWNYIKK